MDNSYFTTIVQQVCVIQRSIPHMATSSLYFGGIGANQSSDPLLLIDTDYLFSTNRVFLTPVLRYLTKFVRIPQSTELRRYSIS